MKKLFTFAMLVIMIGTITGCTKKSSSTTPSYSLKVTVSGATSTFTTCQAVLAGSVLQVTGSSSATTTTPPYFSITIYNFTGAATYTINGSATSPSVAASYWPSSFFSSVKAAQSGSVVVTSSSSTSVSGTFNFTAVDGTTMNSGTFTAKRM